MAPTIRRPEVLGAANLPLYAWKVCRRSWSLILARVAVDIFMPLLRRTCRLACKRACSCALRSNRERPANIAAAACETDRYALHTRLIIERNASFSADCPFLAANSASVHTGAPYRATDLTVFAYSLRTLPLGPLRFGNKRLNVVARTPARLAAAAKWSVKLHALSRISRRYFISG